MTSKALLESIIDPINLQAVISSPLTDLPTEIVSWQPPGLVACVDAESGQIFMAIVTPMTAIASKTPSMEINQNFRRTT
jgi:hypothetical protein